MANDINGISDDDFYGKQSQPTSLDHISDDDFYGSAPSSSPKPRSITDIGKDALVSIGKGVVGAGKGLVGLADIPTLGYAGKALQSAGADFKGTDQFLDDQYSDAQKAANANVSNAQGVGGTLKAIAQNPSWMVQQGLELAPQMLAMGKVGKAASELKALSIGEGLTGDALKAAQSNASAALGNGLMSAGQNAENTRENNADGTLSVGQALGAAGQGVADAALTRGAGALAQSRGVTTAPQAIADKLAGVSGPAAQAGMSRLAQVATGAGIETAQNAAQGAMDTGFQNVEAGRSATQGMGNAAATGGAVGLGMGVISNLAHTNASNKTGNKETPADAALDNQQAVQGQDNAVQAEQDYQQSQTQDPQQQDTQQEQQQDSQSVQPAQPDPAQQDQQQGQQQTQPSPQDADPFTQALTKQPETVQLTDAVNGQTVTANASDTFTKVASLIPESAQLSTASKTGGSLAQEGHVSGELDAGRDAYQEQVETLQKRAQKMQEDQQKAQEQVQQQQVEQAQQAAQPKAPSTVADARSAIKKGDLDSLQQHTPNLTENATTSLLKDASKSGNPDILGHLVSLDKSPDNQASLKIADNVSNNVGKEQGQAIRDAVQRNKDGIIKAKADAEQAANDAAQKAHDDAINDAQAQYDKQVKANSDLVDSVKNNDVDGIHKSLADGGDITQVSNNGASLAHLAAEHGAADSVDALHEATGGQMFGNDRQGDTPLAYAKTPEVHDALVKAGYNQDGAINSYGNSLTHELAKKGYADTLDHVLTKDQLENGQQGTLAHSTDALSFPDGNTPAHYAAERGESGVLDVLAKHGADLSKKNESGVSPIEIAKNKESVKSLVKGGVEINPETGGTTPLHQAALRGNADAVTAMLHNKADASRKDGNGETPLHIAKNKDVVDALLSHDSTLATNKSDHFDALPEDTQQSKEAADAIKGRREAVELAAKEKEDLSNSVSSNIVIKRKSIRLAEGDASDQNHTKQELNDRLKTVLGDKADGVLSNPKFKIITRDEVPAGESDSTKNSRGFVDKDGNVRLIADNIPKDASAEYLHGLVDHEIAVHVMKLGQNDAKFQKIVSDLKSMADRGDARAQKSLEKANASSSGEEFHGEEHVAYYIQDNPKSSIAQRVADWMKVALRRFVNGMKPDQSGKFIKWVNEITHSELIDMASKSLKDFSEHKDADAPQQKGSRMSEENATADDELTKASISGAKKFQHKYQDMLASMNDIVGRVKKAKGGISEESDPTLTRDLDGNKMAREAEEFNAKHQNKIADHLKESGISTDDVDRVWAAIHSGGDKESSSYMKNEEATRSLGFDPSDMTRQQRVDQLREDSPEMAKAIEMMDGMNKEAYNRSVAAGMEKGVDPSKPAPYTMGEVGKRAKLTLNKMILASHKSISDIGDNNLKKSIARFVEEHDQKGQMAKVVEGLVDKSSEHANDGGVKFMDNGVEKSLVFNGKSEEAMSIKKALEHSEGSDNELLKVAGAATKWISNINTHANPIFGIKHGIRNVMHATWVLSASQHTAGKRVEFLKNVASITKNMFTYMSNMKKGLEPQSPLEKMYRDFVNGGGEASFNDTPKTIEEQIKHIDGVINPSKWAKSPAGKAFGSTMDAIHLFNHVMENGTRFAIYKTAVEGDNPASKLRGLQIARNLTVNFAHRGTETGTASKLYGFFNANVQGTASMYRAITVPGEFHTFNVGGKQISVPKISPAGRNILLGGLIAGVAQGAAMQAAGIDDGKLKPEMINKNFMIPNGAGLATSLPIIQGLNALPAMGRLLYESIAYGKPMDRAVSMIGAMADSFSPLGSSSMTAQTLAPTALDPFIALAANDNGMGGKIAKENQSNLSPTPGLSRGKSGDTFIGKGIAGLINTVTGGNDFKAGVASPTASQVDFVLSTLGGGIYSLGLKGIDSAETVAKGQTPQLSQIPLVSQYEHDTNSPSSINAMFTDNVRDMNILETQYKGMLKTPGSDIKGFIQDNPEARLLTVYKEQEEAVRKMESTISQAQNGPNAGNNQQYIESLKQAVVKRQDAFNAMIQKVKSY